MNFQLKYLAIIIAILLVLMILFNIFCILTTENLEITVSEKFIKSSYARGEQSYMIATEEGEVFVSKDTLLFFKFNSTDIYAKMSPGSRYHVKVYGFRIPLFSMYRNIITCKELQKEKS